MTVHVALVVEGQTEEAFVRRVLQPHIGYTTAYLTPIVVHTSRAADGTAFRGGGGWSHYNRHIRTLLSQPHWSLVTTLIDYYGFPTDGPVCSCVGPHIQPACVASREDAIKESLPFDQRFSPFLALHEFETLVIAAGAGSTDVLGESEPAEVFSALVQEHFGNAELINNGAATAPSKRVASIVPDYSKVRDGVAILENGLDRALLYTPRFQTWVSSIQTAGTAQQGD